MYILATIIHIKSIWEIVLVLETRFSIHMDTWLLLLA